MSSAQARGRDGRTVGQVESVVGTLKRELWEVFHFDDRAEAERRLAQFFDEYNERRVEQVLGRARAAEAQERRSLRR